MSSPTSSTPVEGPPATPAPPTQKDFAAEDRHHGRGEVNRRRPLEDESHPAGPGGGEVGSGLRRL
jgi:hypothetical protein